MFIKMRLFFRKTRWANTVCEPFTDGMLQTILQKPLNYMP